MGWVVAGVVAHLWGHGHGWAPSATGARVRGSVVVLAAEVGPWLRLGRLLGHSRGGGGGGYSLRIPQAEAECLIFFLFLFEKFLLLKPAASNKHLASHTAQLSNQTGDYPGQGLSRPNSSRPVSTVPAGAHCPCVFATLSLFPQ